MARKPTNLTTGDSQHLPVTSDQVNDAWLAFAASQRMAAVQPELTQNEYFKAMQDAAYARFVLLLEAL